MISRHEFVEDLKQRLDRLDGELNQLETRARQAKADAQAAYEMKLAALREQRDQARHKFDEIRAAGENAWEHLKHGAEEAWTSLKTALDKARSEFKS